MYGYFRLGRELDDVGSCAFFLLSLAKVYYYVQIRDEKSQIAEMFKCFENASFSDERACVNAAD